MPLTLYNEKNYNIYKANYFVSIMLKLDDSFVE